MRRCYKCGSFTEYSTCSACQRQDAYISSQQSANREMLERQEQLENRRIKEQWALEANRQQAERERDNQARIDRIKSKIFEFSISNDRKTRSSNGKEKIKLFFASVNVDEDDYEHLKSICDRTEETCSAYFEYILQDLPNGDLPKVKYNVNEVNGCDFYSSAQHRINLLPKFLRNHFENAYSDYKNGSNNPAADVFLEDLLMWLKKLPQSSTFRGRFLEWLESTVHLLDQLAILVVNKELEAEEQERLKQKVDSAFTDSDGTWNFNGFIAAFTLGKFCFCPICEGLSTHGTANLSSGRKESWRFAHRGAEFARQCGKCKSKWTHVAPWLFLAIITGFPLLCFTGMYLDESKGRKVELSSTTKTAKEYRPSTLNGSAGHASKEETKPFSTKTPSTKNSSPEVSASSQFQIPKVVAANKSDLEVEPYKVDRPKYTPPQELLSHSPKDYPIPSKDSSQIVRRSSVESVNIISNLDNQYAKADALLNQAYKKAISRLNFGDRERLREEQRNWIKRRDYAASLNPSNSEIIKIRMTIQRTSELEKY